MVSQLITNLEAFRPYSNPQQCNSDIPLVEIPPPVTTENLSDLTHLHWLQEAVFESTYILAYGSFRRPTLQRADNPLII